MYQALYRAYRPEVFSEILGQEHIVRILRNQIKKGETGHAYLLCGTRGTGKTTTARILAKAVNCLSDGDKPCGTCANCQAIKNGTFMDVVEIDAASNNGVENIRDLRESVQYPPVLGRKKVYIIDEVHMLSTGACNALLKTLEEPPEYCMFILATTEPQKLLPTILSRCIRLDFRRVPEYTIKEGMRRICSDRGISVTEDALGLIAVNADGSVRDALSILDQCLAGVQDSLTRDDVIDLSYLEQDRIMQEYLITETSSNHEYTLHDNLELLTILPTDTIRVYEFEKPVKNVILYFETFGIPNVKITTYLNDEVVNSYDVWQFNYIDIPIYEDIDKVVIEGEDVYGNGTEIYMHQEPIDDDYSQRFKQLTNEHFTNVVFDNDHISADITIDDHEKYVFTSIPYDKGWTVKVNGEQIDYEKVQLGFIGFQLDEGTYHIEFDYHIPLLKEGIMVSGGSLLLLLIITYLRKKK